MTNPEVEQCLLIYRAQLKSEGLTGRNYLEMRCQFPGRGEFFSRGLDNPVRGSTDWALRQTPFFLKAGEKPDLVKLNLVVEGRGKVEVQEVELLRAPLPAGLQHPAPQSWEILDRHGRSLREVRHGEDGFSRPVTLSEVALALVHATLAAEDKRFWQHPGVDWRALLRSAADLVRHRRVVSPAPAGVADQPKPVIPPSLNPPFFS